MTRMEAAQLGLLTRRDLIRSAKMSESSFDRLGLEPAKRVGRLAFYSLRDCMVAKLAKDLRREFPRLTADEARIQGEQALSE